METRITKFLDRRFDSAKISLGSALRQRFGLGEVTVRSICCRFGVSPSVILGSAPPRLLLPIEHFLTTEIRFDRPLRKLYFANVQRKKKLGTIGGLRLSQKLPSRGQRTHSNGKTAKRALGVILT